MPRRSKKPKDSRKSNAADSSAWWYRRLAVVSLGVCLVVGIGFSRVVGVDPRALPGIPWQFFGEGFVLRWTPSGADRVLKPADCQRQHLRDLIRSHHGPSNELSKKVQSWLDRCDHKYAPPTYNYLQVLLDFFLINYNYHEDPRVKIRTFELKNGKTVKGMLAFQRSKQPRPLIFARCGVACDLSNGPDKSTLFMHLMEESGFHLVILTSASSTLYAKDNSEMFVSGIEEGAQMLEILAQMAQDPEWERVSDVHLMGVSLGGNGALFASRFALKTPELKIRSALVMCPVVDMEAQLTAALAEDMRGFFFDSQIREIFSHTQSQVKEISKSAPDISQASRRQLLDIILRGSFKILSTRATSSDLLGIPRPKNYEDYVEALRFQHLRNSKGVPTLAIHAEDDMLVPWHINSKALGEGGPNVGVVKLPRGNHCAFNQGIEWSTYSELLRSYFIRYSTEWSPSPFKVQLSDLLEFPAPKEIGQELVGANWTVAGVPYRLSLRLVFKSSKIAQVSGPYCQNSEASTLPPFCLEEVVVPIHAGLMERIHAGLHLEAMTVVQDYRQISMIARWLNSRSVLYNGKDPAVGLPGLPTHLLLDTSPDF